MSFSLLFLTALIAQTHAQRPRIGDLLDRINELRETVTGLLADLGRDRCDCDALDERLNNVEEELFKCYYDDDKGFSYTGSYTEPGCLPWATVHDNNDIDPSLNLYTYDPAMFPELEVNNHNYCRNPDNDTRPWCWTDVIISYEGWKFCETLESCP